MPKAIRKGDLCKGHVDWPSRPNDEGSPNVFINQKEAHRVGDHWVTHCNPAPECHDSVAATGSPDVIVNGKPLCRVNDMVACGSPMGATHSPDVIVNG